MGLFSFFSKYTEQEKALLATHSQMLIMMGVNPQETKKQAKELLDTAIQKSKKEGTYDLPDKMGDIILIGSDAGNPAVNRVIENMRQKLPKKKNEGVREEDFRWWWNLNDVERNMMVISDDISRYQAYSFELEKRKELMENYPEKIVIERVRKSFPMFGNPDDTTHTTGEDRPLPFELKSRVNSYIEKRVRGNQEQFRIDLEQSSTFNALIRREIKAGVL